MKTLVVANQKGGVGKTALVCLLAHHLAERGQRVLVVDLDHQGNATHPLSLSGKVQVGSTLAESLFADPTAEVPGGPFVLAPSSPGLRTLERQADAHNTFARNLRAFLHRHAARFDTCLVDTNPNPDIRVVAALVSADCVLSPIQLNQESIDGIAGLFNDPRVGVVSIRQRLNPRLRFLGMLPMLVEPTPFQKVNLAKVMASRTYRAQLLAFKDDPGPADFAFIPKRTVIAECQASGRVLWEVRNQTAARDASKEVRPVLERIAELVEAA